ncbi:MAG: ABC transporter permease subunit [Nitrospirae bacterium]|nr:ABC transporter permease subunit [Nitrospirota bacterium]
MSKLLAVCARELRSLLVSPIAAVCVAMFLLVTGYLFYTIVIAASVQTRMMLRMQQMAPQLNINEMILAPSLRNFSVILLLIVPLLTMRLIAEERKQKTSELLLTSPVTVAQLILGKYLAVLALYGVMLGLTLYMPLLLGRFGPVVWWPVFSGYLGLFLVGAVFLAVGLLASALTENQMIAAIISFSLLIVMWLLGWVGAVTADTQTGPLLTYLSLLEHLNNFLAGLIDTKDVVYLLGLIAVSLFLAHRVVESQRWR